MFLDLDVDVMRLVNSFMIIYSVIYFYLFMNLIFFLMLFCSLGMVFFINCVLYLIVLGIFRFFFILFF